MTKLPSSSNPLSSCRGRSYEVAPDNNGHKMVARTEKPTTTLTSFCDLDICHHLRLFFSRFALRVYLTDNMFHIIIPNWLVVINLCSLNHLRTQYRHDLAGPCLRILNHHIYTMWKQIYYFWLTVINTI